MKKTIVLFLLLCACQLHTQTRPDFQLLTTADGLSQGMVFDVLQSKDGSPDCRNFARKSA